MDQHSTRVGNPLTITEHVATRVAAEITRRGRYKTDVARQAHIAPATFSRKVNGQTDFTIPELARVGAALGCDWTTFLPLPAQAMSA